MTATAQTFEGIEELSAMIQNEDPMLGTKSDTIWISDHVEISPFLVGKRIVLKKPDHIFTTEARLGYYSSDGKLLYMVPSIMMRTNQDRTRGEFNVAFSKDTIPYGEYSDDKYYDKKSWRARVDDILKWLQNTDGYIRIVCVTYGNYIYDIKFRLRK